jgi:hypothetical protein
MKLVSDVVAASTIQAATQDCDRDGCCLSATTGETTCMGISRYYDKSGQLTVNDRNSRSTTVGCSVCWKYRLVKQKGDTIQSVTDVTDLVEEEYRRTRG